MRATCRGVVARGTRRCAGRGASLCCRVGCRAGLCRRLGTPVVAAGLVARLLALRALPGVALAHLLVLIRDPTTVLGIVLPLLLVDVLLVDVRLVEGFAVVDVHVVVVLVAAAAPAPSPSVVVVDVHLVTAPVAAARDRGADRHAGTERQQTRRRDVAGRVRVHRRIGGRVGGRAVDRLRDVRRHVDDLRIGRDDLDDLLLDHHLLLLRRLELAGLVGLPPHALDGIEHVRLLSEEDVPQLRGPVEVLRHPTEHVGEVRERLDARVPGLRLERLVELLPAQLRTFLDPALGLHDLERVGRGHQDLHEQRIGIERDRGHQLVEPLGRGPLRCRSRPGGRRLLLGREGGQRKDARDEQDRRQTRTIRRRRLRRVHQTTSTFRLPWSMAKPSPSRTEQHRSP